MALKCGIISKNKMDGVEYHISHASIILDGRKIN